MGGFNSGGSNRLSAAEHIIRGTFRQDRHGSRQKPRPVIEVSAADRRRLLRGLDREARGIAVGLLETYQGWDVSSLVTLRAYALSCVRVSALEAAAGPDTRALHRELRINVVLRKTLGLERHGAIE